MRRKKKRIQITIMYIVILILLSVIGYGTYLSLKAHFRNSPTGTWNLKVDMSEPVISSVNGWLDNYEQIDFAFNPVIIKASFEKDGTYNISIDDDSYNAYVNSVHEYVKKRFSLVVESNLLVAGYTGDDISSVSDELIEEAVEGDLGTYLEANGVELSKPKESFNKYLSEGTYEYNRKDGLLILSANDGTQKNLRVDLSEDVMVLKGEEEDADVNTDTERESIYPLAYSRIE